MTLQLIIVLILVGGWLFGRLFARIRLPGVLGMTLWGLAIGTLWRDAVPKELWDMAPFLKSLALIVILLRAGLGIRLDTLKKVGAAVMKMSFLPALFEAAALTALFRFVLGFEWVVAALAALLLSAVSPAVVVPSMLHLKERGYGGKRDVPTMILAGAGLDNVIVITLFTLCLGFAKGDKIGLLEAVLAVPRSLVLGVLPGLVVGFFLVWVFERYYDKIRATEKTLLLLGVSFLLVQVGDWMQAAALLGIMTVGFILLARADRVAKELSSKLGKVWVASEIVLFVLIGMSVKLDVALRAGPLALVLVAAGLIARSAGVWAATAGSALDRKERLFSVVAYLPKATVQAALGAVPLQEGVSGGEVILAYAVLAIFFTTPLGLVGIRLAGPKLLNIDIGEDEWEDAGD